MADKKYLGLGVIFKAIDQDFTKTSKQVQGSLSSTSNHLDKVQNSINKLEFDNLNNLFSTFKLFEDSISQKDYFGSLQSGLYALEDDLVNFTNFSKQAAENEQLQKHLITLRDNGRITQEQFISLSKAMGDISDLNFPLPNVDTLNELSQFMEEQREFIPRMSSGLDGWSLSTLGLENAIDKVNRQFKAQQKVKSINKYKVELENLHRQGKISSKDFQKITTDLNKLSDSFIKRARDPESFFKKIYNGAKYASAPMRDLGSKIFDLGKTVIANLPSVTEGLIGSGEVGQLGSDLDFLKTKMSLVMNDDQANKFNNSLMGVMRTTGMTADQAGNLANAMNRYGVSVEDSTELMPFLGDLVGKMGLDGQQVAEMGGQLTRTLGMSVDQAKNLTKRFYQMGKARGFVDFLEDMPEITKEVNASFKQLGITNAKVADKAIMSNAALTSMYRGLNIEQKTAVQAALKMQKALTGMSMDIKRLSVGLEPENFDAMIDVAGEITRLTGKSADEAFQMIQDGAKDTEGFMKNMMNIANLPTTTEKDLVRLSEITRKIMGDEAADILMNKDLRDRAASSSFKALQEEAKLKEKGEDPLAKDQERLTATFKVTQDLFKTNKELLQAMAEMEGKGAILKSWNDQLGEWQKKQDAIVRGSAEGELLIAAFVQQAAGLAGLANLAGLDNLGKGLATAGANAQVLETALRSISGLTSGLSGFGAIFASLAFGTLPALFKIIGKVIPLGKIFGLGKGDGGGGGGSFLGKMVQNLSKAGSALGNFAIGVKDKFVGLGSSVLSKLGGFSSSVADKFGGLASSALSKVSHFTGSVTSKFGEMISNTAPKFASFVKDIPSKLSGLAQSLPKLSGISSLTDAFGKLSGSLLGKAGLVGAAGAAGVAVGYLVSNLISKYTQGITAEGFKGDILERGMFKFAKFFNMDMVQQPGVNVRGQKLTPEELQKRVDQAEIKPSTAVSTPIINQSEAPTLSRVPTETPRMSMEKEKGNTLDDVVKTLVEVRNSFVEEIQNISNKPVYVMLQGDAKKFFKAVSMENADQMGVRGLQNQAVFGG